MKHSEICPICKGSGKCIYINKFVSMYGHYPFTSIPMLYNENVCHGCEGKGWVTVQDDYSDSDQDNHIPHID